LQQCQQRSFDIGIETGRRRQRSKDADMADINPRCG
jgi:hypothetical protein